jgi:hypothetical protein
MFFQTYGNVFSLYVADKSAEHGHALQQAAEPRDLPFVQEALASMTEGGYAEALARIACLLARKGEPLLLTRLQTKHELLEAYRDLLPAMAPDQWRRVRGEQEIIVRYEPEKALSTLPQLLKDPADREKLARAVRALVGDERFHRVKPSTEQLAMADDIRETLGVKAKLPAPAKRKAKRRAVTVTTKPAPKRRTARTS